MYWLEKLDIIKKEHPAPAFRDMFRKGGEVVEKIIRVFHNATYLTFITSEKLETLLKGEPSSKEMSILEFENLLPDLLEEDQNYWLLLVDVFMGKGFQVYDCRKQPLLDVFYMSWSRQSQLRFYIVDKKYKWLRFVDMNRNNDKVQVYESKIELSDSL